MEGKKVIRIVNNKPRAFSFFFYRRRRRRNNRFWKARCSLRDNSSLTPDDLGIRVDGAARRRCCVEQTGSGGGPTLGTTDPNFFVDGEKKVIWIAKV